MALVNRDKDLSEQRDIVQAQFGLIGTGATLHLAVVPYFGQIQGIQVSSVGLSGSPTMLFGINRFIVGTGFTTITGGATTLTISAVGTSGPQAFVLAAAGSSLLTVQQGDVLVMSTATANTAASSYAISVVMKALQDVKVPFGITT